MKSVTASLSSKNKQHAPNETSFSLLTQDSKKQWVEVLYKTHKVILCKWLHKRYAKCEAEEIAQKAFMKLLELNSIEHIHNPKAFLYTTAVNFALLDIRSRATGQKYIDQEIQNISQNVEEITPERIYNSAERFKRIIASMANLTFKQKKVLQLSRIEGKTYQQIQQQTGWSLADISRQMTQAMSLIRKDLPCPKARNAE